MNFIQWLTVLGVLTGSAQADILFIDLNISSKEVAAAREAAKLRGEELIVLPNVSDQLRKEFAPISGPAHEAEDRKERTAAIYQSLLNQVSKHDSPELEKKIDLARTEKEKANTDYEIKKYAVDDFVKAHPEIAFKSQDLERVLTEIQKKSATDPRRALTSLIYSSHHESNIWGYAHDSHMALSEIIGPIQAHHLGGQLKSVYGWACYSNTKSELENWRKEFPSLNVVAG